MSQVAASRSSVPGRRRRSLAPSADAAAKDVIIAATHYRYRAQWFFWFLCIYGAAMCISYMLPFGVCFLLFALLKRKEFDLDPAPEPGTLVR